MPHEETGSQLKTGSGIKYEPNQVIKKTQTSAKYEDPTTFKHTSSEPLKRDSDVQITSTSYSNKYVAMNLSKVIEALVYEIEGWRDKYGDSNSIRHIHKLKHLLMENDRYFLEKKETRIFSSLLKLIFSENKWLEITPPQLNQLIQAMKQFTHNELSEKKLQTFFSQIFRANIEIL